jgi:5'-3' exonuclease
MHIAIIDLSGLFYAAWHASADLEVNEAYHRTLGSVREIAARYEHVAICCDSGRTFRHELAPETYKAHRERPPVAMIEQLRRCQVSLESDGYWIAKADGFEADDCAGTLVHWLADREVTATLVSDDKDWCQLVSEKVDIYRPRTQTTLDLEQVTELFGVVPRQIPDLLALMGDKSDGIAGVPGIGAKRAAAILQKHGTIGGLMEQAYLVGGDHGLTDKLLAAVQAADQDKTLQLAMKLTPIRRDVPIDCELALQPVVPKGDSGQPIEAEFDAEDTEDPDVPISYTPTSSETKALAVRDTSFERELEPRDLDSAKALAKHAFDSRMFSAYGSPQAVLMTILSGRSLGLDAMQALRSIHIVEGKPTLSAQLLMALCLRHPTCEYFYEVSSSNEAAVYETKRRGNPGPTRLTFTMDDAVGAGLAGRGNWKKYPRAMLRNRCVAELARAVYPDATANVYLEEELER